MGTRLQDEEEDEDRLSFLPDDLLCPILSLLPTKEIVATSALATRWKNLYASITDLNFDDSKPGTTTPANNASFINFVTNVISAVLFKSNYIHKMNLSCSQGPYTASVVASWIAAVSGPNLQSLYIWTKNQAMIDPVPLPPQLFYCKALTSMSIRGKFSLFVPAYLVFPCLKFLSLSKLILPDDMSLKRFFGGFVVLEELVLCRCKIESVSVLEVSMASLKHLTLDITGNYELLLNTPNLESLNYEGYAGSGYSGDILTSLVRAEVKMDIGDEGFFYPLLESKAFQLINMVSTTRSLWLELDSMDLLKYQATSSFYNLTKLTVSTSNVRGWPSLPELLKNAPSLEFIDFSKGLQGEYDEKFADIETYLPEQVPVCVSSRLKEVIFRRFCGEEVEYKVVEYFLKNAEVLEKISVSPRLIWDWGLKHHVQLSNEVLLRMTERLLGLSSWSKTCQVALC